MASGPPRACADLPMGSHIASNVRWFSDRRRKAKRAAGFNIVAIRCAELERLFMARYGSSTLPDDDAGRDDALLMAHHLAHRPGEPSQRIAAWLGSAASWMNCAEREDIAAVIAKPLRWRADKLAARLGLTDVERQRLKIRTIGAVDLGKAARATRRAER
jgi:hypothetical protein